MPHAMSNKFCEITGKIMFDHPFNSFNVLGHSSTWVSLKEREKKNDFLPYEEIIFFPSDLYRIAGPDISGNTE